jgi:hypothetical protein
MTSIFSKENIKEWFASLALAFTLFFFAPVSIYVLNARTIQISIWDIWYLYLGAAILASLILFLAT